MKHFWWYVALMLLILEIIVEYSRLESALTVAKFSLVLTKTENGILLTNNIPKYVATNQNISLMLDRIGVASSSTLADLLHVVLTLRSPMSGPNIFK